MSVVILEARVVDEYATQALDQLYKEEKELELLWKDFQEYCKDSYKAWKTYNEDYDKKLLNYFEREAHSFYRQEDAFIEASGWEPKGLLSRLFQSNKQPIFTKDLFIWEEEPPREPRSIDELIHGLIANVKFTPLCLIEVLKEPIYYKYLHREKCSLFSGGCIDSLFKPVRLQYISGCINMLKPYKGITEGSVEVPLQTYHLLREYCDER